MEYLRLSIISFAMLACAAVHAAAVYVEESAAYPGAYAIYLDGESLNGDFNVVDFTVSPVAPATFQKYERWSRRHPPARAARDIHQRASPD